MNWIVTVRNDEGRSMKVRLEGVNLEWGGEKFEMSNKRTRWYFVLPSKMVVNVQQCELDKPFSSEEPID